MKNIKILLSDPHFQPFRDRKFESQKRNLFEIIIIWTELFAHWTKTVGALLLGREMKVLNREEETFLDIREIVKRDEIDICISNGDFSESLCTEQGMKTEEDFRVALTLREKFKKVTGIKYLEEGLGNHESGYNLPLCTDPEAGIYWKSIQNFLKMTGRDDIYHSFMCEGYRFILIPYIFSESSAVDFDLVETKKEFLDKLRNDFLKDIPIIICIHDPDSFIDSELLRLVRENRDKIKFIFYGHYHSWLNLLGNKILIGIYNSYWAFLAQWVLNSIFFISAKGEIRIVRELGKYFRSRKNIPSIIKELSMILIPAPNGMLGIGGGFRVLEISNDGSFQIKKV